MNPKTISVKFNNSTAKDAFSAVLRRRVDAYFKENNISKHANATMVLKTIILLTAYILPFICLLYFKPTFGVSMFLWFVMGLGVAGIGMSIMHDANHGAYSSIKWVNTLLGHTLNLVGGAVLNWKLQHNVLHHTYTNVSYIDEDIADRAVLKFSPHTPVKSHHQMQYVYAFFFYGLLTIYWVVAKDFVQYFKFKANGVNKNTTQENVLFLIKLVATKVLYLGVMFFVPCYFFGFSFGEIFAGFFLMHFVAGLILTVVFQLAHSIEGTTHPLPKNGMIDNDWYIHQMETTANFSPDSAFISWYVGGLNYQVEHHLFPTICHVHYPQIAPIVEATAKEFGIPYLVNYRFVDALQAHIDLLHRVGRLPKLDEAIA
jgi:linoleoyl-CoA desaturase